MLLACSCCVGPILCVIGNISNRIVTEVTDHNCEPWAQYPHKRRAVELWEGTRGTGGILMQNVTLHGHIFLSKGQKSTAKLVGTGNARAGQSTKTTEITQPSLVSWQLCNELETKGLAPIPQGGKRNLSLTGQLVFKDQVGKTWGEASHKSEWQLLAHLQFCSQILTVVSAYLTFFFSYRKMTTEGGTIFVFSGKSLQMWPWAFSLNRQTQEELLNCLRGLIPPSNWKQPMPVDQQLRNSSRKNRVILAHGKGSDYSVVSLCQKCHDISMRQAVKQTSFHCLLQERVRGYVRGMRSFLAAIG